MKVVLDSNVYISTLISQRGNPHYIFESWLQGEIELLVTQTILDEVARVLHYPRIAKRHKLGEAGISQFVDILLRQATLVQPVETLNVVVADESDNHYLKCAVAGKADYLVTGDEHLLGIQSFRGVYILNPAEFAALLRIINRDNN